jgi:hypothetical protein
MYMLLGILDLSFIDFPLLPVGAFSIPFRSDVEEFEDGIGELLVELAGAAFSADFVCGAIVYVFLSAIQQVKEKDIGEEVYDGRLLEARRYLGATGILCIVSIVVFVLVSHSPDSRSSMVGGS